MVKNKHENGDNIEKKEDYINKYYKPDNSKFTIFYEKKVSGVNFYSDKWKSILKYGINPNKFWGSSKINSSYYEWPN